MASVCSNTLLSTIRDGRNYCLRARASAFAFCIAVDKLLLGAGKQQMGQPFIPAIYFL